MKPTIVPQDLISRIRASSPLIQHITNSVTINDCANITLAAGGSPAMADSPDEAGDFALFSGAVVLNMGTVHQDSLRAMVAAGAAARSRKIPVVFDPVAAGATPWRRQVAQTVMAEVYPSLIKGNAAEIRFLAGLASRARGVDSLETEDPAPAALQLAQATGATILVTGAVDVVADRTGIWRITGGHELLGQVCGTGCMTASLAACCAAILGTGPGAAVGASLMMKVSGEVAARSLGVEPEQALVSRPDKPSPLGLGSFRIALFDALSRLQDRDLTPSIRVTYEPV